MEGRLGARPARAGCACKAGGRCGSCSTSSATRSCPTLDDYYEPWTYDYETLISAPLLSSTIPWRARDRSSPASRCRCKWGPNWEDDLARRPRARRARPEPRAGSRSRSRLEYEQAFMFYLPRICEHCLNPSCVASCPSGAMYKREEDGIVLVDQDKCRGWRMCVSGCPYKKVYFNHRTGKAEKCTFCYPRIEAGQPTVCSETCVGRLRYIGLVLYDADRVQGGRVRRPIRQHLLDAQLGVFLDPHDPAVLAAGAPRRHRRGLDRSGAALAGLRAGHALPGRAAAAPRVPHPADGLVRAAALAGGERARGAAASTADPDDVFPAIESCASPSSTWPNLLAAGDAEVIRVVLQAAGGDARLHAAERSQQAGRSARCRARSA